MTQGRNLSSLFTYANHSKQKSHILNAALYPRGYFQKGIFQQVANDVSTHFPLLCEIDNQLFFSLMYHQTIQETFQNV